jgi:Zn-dependent protease with chaperone function
VNSISDLKAKAYFLFWKYKLRMGFVVGTLGWIATLKVAEPFLTPTIRLLLVYSFAPIFLGFAAAFSQFLASPISFSVDTYLYNRKHQPEDTDFPELYEVAKRMGYAYSKKIQLTDNPKIVSAYTNMTTGQIVIPRSWKEEKYTFEQLLSILAHEVAHLKTRKWSYVDMLWVMGGTAAASLIIAMLLPTVFAQIGGLAAFYLLLSLALRGNEYRADEVAARIVGPDHLIEVFEDFAKENKDGSESHPSPKRRIERLRRIFGMNKARTLMNPAARGRR